MAAPSVTWALPMDPQFATFARGPALAAALAVVVAVVFLDAWRRGVTALRRARAVAVLSLLGCSVAVVAALLAWLAPGTPAADVAWHAATAPLGTASLLAAFVAFPVGLAFLFGIACLAMARGRWREAYLALAAGPGLAALLVTFKLAYPRWAPAPEPFFSGPTALANDAAALWTMAGLVVAFVGPRLGLGAPARRLARFLPMLGLVPLLTGRAWLTDAVFGLALATAWWAVCRLAWDVALPTTDTPKAGFVSGLDAAAQWILAKPGPWLWGIILFGVALRVLTWWTSPLAVDAFSYAVLGQSLATHGNLTMPWGEVDTFHTLSVASHHYPPLYPAYLAAWYKVAGFSQDTTRLAAMASSLAALAVVYACTRDLYGKQRALVATAVLAVSPILVQNTGQGYSENFVLLLFVLTLWAILKSLTRPWFIVPAGALAGLGYLAKSSMGYFFIVAGLGGLAWRLRWRGWKVLRDPSYVTAIALFGAVVGAWALRNLMLFGTWETSFHLSDAYRAAFAHPFHWGYLFLVTLVFYATVGYLLFLALLPVLPWLARIPKLADEHDSGLWLALGLPLVLTAAIDAALWLIEGEFFLNNVRYIAFVMVPALWLLLRHLRLDTRAVRLAVVATFVLLAAGSAYFAKPSSSYTQAMADDLVPRLGPDDSVAFVDENNHYAYRFYFHLTDNGAHPRHLELGCVRHPLCPADALRAKDLNTTWVYAPLYAASELQDRYHMVDSPVTYLPPPNDAAPILWRHD